MLQLKIKRISDYFYIKIIIKKIRILINLINRKRLKNHDFSLLSSNCNGALILKDLNQKFLSPTVNLYFSAEDYIKFLENLDFYLNQEIKSIAKPGINYPIGKLEDIEIHFMHYASIEVAKEKWEERCKRINHKNLFVMMTDRDGCTEDIIRRFNNLSFKNKVLFTNREYKLYNSTFYIRGFENQGSVGHIFEFRNILGRKYYDDFDYVNWFNTGMTSS